MAERDPEAILARFPGPVVLYPSRMKWLLVFAMSALFAVGGVAMVRDGASGGWYVLIFFGLCTVVAAVALLPGAGSLKLDADGFVLTGLFRRSAFRWRDVTAFESASIPPSGLNMVVFDHANAGGHLAKLNAAVAGRNAALPDTYGLSADDLADVMAQWRTRAVAGGRRPPR